MMASRKGTRAKLLALLVCAGLLSGPVRPVAVFASEDGGEEIEGGEVVDNAAAGEDVVVEEEPSASEAAAQENPVVNKLQQQIEDLNQKIEGLKSETKKLEAGINEAKTEKEKALAVRNSLDYQISLTKDEISYLGQRIDLLEQDIDLRELTIQEMQLEIERKQAQIDYNYELLKQRLRAQQVNDSGSMLGLLLTADSFADFLSKTEHMLRIAEHDQQLLETLNEEKTEIEREKDAVNKEKTELEHNMAQVAADKAETESKKKDLDGKYVEAASMVQDYAQMEERFFADLEKNKAMQAEMKAEVNNIYKQIELSKNPYVGGVMAWPLPGFTQVSSEFGLRFNGTDYHTGIDLTGGGCHGAQIVAANDGVVKFVNTSYTPGRGYGIYVIVDHGGNVSTLYAHCSAILVSVDQEVKRGEPIALVGSTGWSTGPHLHFEVRTGPSSTPQNPRGYIFP